MNELLIWNTLTESASWLSETLGKQVTPKSLIQTILDRAVATTKPLKGAPLPPTIIKALLPRNVQFASVWLTPKEGDIGEFEMRTHERMTAAHGTLHFFPYTVYTGYVAGGMQAIPLFPADIADLIIRGNIEISLIHEHQLGGREKLRNFEYVYILPVGTNHIATIETCGINRDDLMALANQSYASDDAQASDTQILTDVKYWATTDSLVEAFKQYGLTEEKIRNGSTKYIKDARKLQGLGGKGRASQPMFCPYEIMQGLVNKARPNKLSEKRGWQILKKDFPVAYSKFQDQDPNEWESKPAIEHALK